jgi:hypothetical protein
MTVVAVAIFQSPVSQKCVAAVIPPGIDNRMPGKRLPARLSGRISGRNGL